jgi:hypothetical protein
MSSYGAPIPGFQLPYTSYGQNGQNGRVTFHGSDQQNSATGRSVPDRAGFSHPVTVEADFSGDMLRGNWEKTELSSTFFTRRNVENIQKQLRDGVYRASGPKQYKIDDQDVDEIKTIMRAMFLTYAKNNPFQIQEQVRELNKLVVDWAVPRIVSEIDQHMFYLKDISHLPVPMEKPLNVSSAGTKSLPFKPMM